MKYLRHLFRQPLKTATGIVLVTLAVAILCVSIGQAFAVRRTEQKMNNEFTTVAMFKNSYTVSDELRTWLEKTAGEHPDIIKLISEQGFLSSYIPGLVPLNYTDPEDGNYIDTSQTGPTTVRPWPHGRPYSCAMFVITIEKVGGVVEKSRTYTTSEELTLDDFATYDDFMKWREENYAASQIIHAYTLELEGTVTEVLSLGEGYADPVGRKIKLTFSASKPRQKDLMALTKMKKGQQCIVYGMDYRDKDWELRNEIENGEYPECIIESNGTLTNETVELDGFDMTKMHILTTDEKIEYEEKYKAQINSLSRVTLPHARYEMEDGRWLYVTESQYKVINSVTLTLGIPISKVNYELIREYEGGPVKEVRYITEYTYFDGEEYVTCTEDEYTEIYKIPTIARLNGTVEEFLNSADGAEWKAAMERDAVNNNAFLTIGVDNLGYLIDFVRGDSVITSGRDFTIDEREGGGRVCIMHEALAAQNGLSVGDKVTMNFYHGDKDIPYDKKATGWGEFLVPNAAFYYKTNPIVETAEYTIVGLWRGELLWPDVRENEYSFSPNTIFVPEGSAETEFDHSESILYMTPVVQNGKLEEFRHLAEEGGFSNCFTYYDRGYSLIMKNFINYENMAVQVLAIGCTIYGVIILLYLMFYPGSYSKSVRTMESLGVSYFKRVAFVWGSSMFILTLSTLLGSFAGTYLWKYAVDALKTSAGTAAELLVDPNTLITIVIAQFVLVTLLNILVSLYVAIPKKMSARR